MLQIEHYVDGQEHPVVPIVLGPLFPPEGFAEQMPSVITALVLSLWEEWRVIAKETEPDTDDEFCNWLVEQRGWEWPEREEMMSVSLSWN